MHGGLSWPAVWEGTPTADTAPAPTRSPRRRTPPLVVAVAVPLVVVAVALLVSDLRAPRPDILHDLRQALHDVAGVLFFGAGLLQLFLCRASADHGRAHAGVVLLLLGLLAPRMTALGPSLHRDVVEAVLSPWTAAMSGLLLLAVDLAAGHRDRGVPPRGWYAAGAGGLLVLLVGGPVLAHRAPAGGWDMPTPAQVAVELGVAALLLLRAARLHALARRGEPVVPVVHLRTLATLAAVWVLRGAAVLDLSWSIASAALLTGAAALALASSTVDLAEAETLRDDEVARAEEALAAADRALGDLEARRRSWRHDTRNSLFALQAAARVLVDHGDHLDTDTRTRLRTAITSELADLERLLTGVPTQRPRAFTALLDDRASA